MDKSLDEIIRENEKSGFTADMTKPTSSMTEYRSAKFDRFDRNNTNSDTESDEDEGIGSQTFLNCHDKADKLLQTYPQKKSRYQSQNVNNRVANVSGFRKDFKNGFERRNYYQQYANNRVHGLGKVSEIRNGQTQNAYNHGPGICSGRVEKNYRNDSKSENFLIKRNDAIERNSVSPIELVAPYGIQIVRRKFIRQPGSNITFSVDSDITHEFIAANQLTNPRSSRDLAPLTRMSTPGNFYKP